MCVKEGMDNYNDKLEQSITAVFYFILAGEECVVVTAYPPIK